MRNAAVRRKIPCLRLQAGDMPWLVVEDTPTGREEGLVLIFGEDIETFAPETLSGIDRLIVQRCEYTKAQMDALPDWEP